MNEYDFKPNLIGIGVQKCASTWVYRIIEDHPQVGVSDPKELDFFTCRYHYGFQWYLKHFQGFSDKQVRAEISPSYFTDPLAPARVAEFNPEVKIIVTLRDPVKRAFSNHLHEIRLGHFCGTDLTFEYGMKNNPMYLEQSRYAKYLEHWLEYFSEDRVLVLLQEEIQHDPITQSKRLYGFLGIDTTHQSSFLCRRANESYGEKVVGVEKSLKSLARIGRKLGMTAVVDHLRKNGLVHNIRASNRVHLSSDIPPMLPGTESLLISELANDIERLSKLLKRDNLPWASWDKLKS
ncbi:MAG: sulfotransferase domain-containing protein [Candidatus Sedimenticola sp. 6PFRAG1]